LKLDIFVLFSAEIAGDS